MDTNDTKMEQAHLQSDHRCHCNLKPKAFKTWFHERRQRTHLTKMLNDKRFAKGFRSTQRLADGIGADRTTTERLLLTIGAWRSEVSDEWTLSRKPPK